MIALILFAVLFDSTIEVPASRWKIIDLPVATPGMELEASFQAPSESSKLAMILLTREDALRFDEGRSVKPLSSTAWTQQGRVRYRFERAGNYALVLDNRIEGRRPTSVAIRAEVRHHEEVTVRELSPQRKVVVIATSLLIFVAIVMYTARKFAQ